MKNTGEVTTIDVSPDAPAHAYPFHEAFHRSVTDMYLDMYPMEDSSGQKVLISLSLKHPNWTSSIRNYVYFKFDFLRYTLEDFLKVIKRLDKDLFVALRPIEKTGNIVDLSVLIDFEKTLADPE